MCTGKVDPSFVVTSFKEKADGITIVGCLPGECHYTTEGNIQTYGMTLILKKILRFIGIEPKRLRMEFLSSADGVKFAENMHDFIGEIKGFGPIGKKEGIDEVKMEDRLNVVLSLIPYIKLVERERLRFYGNNTKMIEEYFESPEVNRIIEDMIFEKISMGLIIKTRKKGINAYKDLAERSGTDERKVFNIIKELEAQGFLKPEIQAGS